jgi:hypothetical protein
MKSAPSLFSRWILKQALPALVLALIVSTHSIADDTSRLTPAHAAGPCDATEIGMKFHADTAGTITGVRSPTSDGTYVISCDAPVGFYSSTLDYFNTGGVDSASLHAPSTGADGLNGVYAFGASRFPMNSSRSSNYWVDVVFNRS